MRKPRFSRIATASAAAALCVPLTGCITVRAPEQPIEINLNVDIRQEVLVRLQRDVEQLIQQNPDAFPQAPR
ncbi:MAG TPA: YnbE family lipoprotein [Sphingomicrobium sp.]|nr:YnbE family lipoprotein [Sphingomicrobium sp.]